MKVTPRCSLIPFIVLVLLIAVAGIPATARAQLLLTLTPPARNLPPGGSAVFTGSLVNTGTQPVFLNAANVELSGPGLTTDLSYFRDNLLGLSLAADGGRYDGPLFGVSAATSTPLGSYEGTFTVRGGASADVFNALASQSFIAVVAIPEPGTLFLTLLAGSLLLCGGDRERCKKATRDQRTVPGYTPRG